MSAVPELPPARDRSSEPSARAEAQRLAPDGFNVPSRGSAHPRKRIFWAVLLLVAAADVVTKELARTHLLPEHMPRNVIGDVFRLTLIYNPGAAFGFNVGTYSRWIFTGLTIIAIAVLWRLYTASRPNDSTRALALGLVSGGAVGNLVNRLWSSRGVVDFLDVGVRGLRWPTFNLADVGVTAGALLLAMVLWSEDRRNEPGGG